MTKSEIIAAYQQLSADEQIRFLADLASCVTVCARGTYVAGTEDVADPPKLRAFNEALHRIVGQLGKLIDDDQKRYPDDVFAEMMIAWAENLGFESNLVSGLQRGDFWPSLPAQAAAS